jgi:prevent-host-death family protein
LENRMDRHISISELRRRPMGIIREALESAEGVTITYRGAPVAVIRGQVAPREWAPDSETAPGLDPAGAAYSLQGCAVSWVADDWPGSNGDPQTPVEDAALDSASWGQWEGLPESQRRALVRAVQQRGGGPDAGDVCENPTGPQSTSDR